MGKVKRRNTFFLKKIVYFRITDSTTYYKSTLTTRKPTLAYLPEASRTSSEYSLRQASRLESQLPPFTLKSASNLNGNLNCSKELEHYSS